MIFSLSRGLRCVFPAGQEEKYLNYRDAEKVSRLK